MYLRGGVNIVDSNGHVTHSADRTHGTDTPASVVIGNNVWIGINSTILKGTVIGDNCVVGAGSVVKGVYPANTIISNGIACVKGIVRES